MARRARPGHRRAERSTFTSGPENGTLLQEAIFTFTGTDNRTPSADLTFECALDSTTSWNSCTSPEQFSDLTRGSHTLRLRAIDAAGNIESTPDAYTWIVAPPPVVTILSGPGVEQEESTDTTVTFTFSADVSPRHLPLLARRQVQPARAGRPGAARCRATRPVRPTRTSASATTCSRCARSTSSATSACGRTSEFRRHPVRGPDHLGPGERDEHDGDLRVHERAVRPRRGLLLLARRPPVRALRASPKTYTNLFPGEHTFQVQTLYTGVDWMGLPFEHDPIPAVHTWTVQDFTAPDTTIDFGPPATTLSTSAYLQVSSDDPTATIECTLTGPTGTAAGRLRARRRDRAHRPRSGRLHVHAPSPPTCPATSTRARPRTRGRSARPPARRTRRSATTSSSPLGDVTVTFFSVEHRRHDDRRPARRRPVAARGLRRRQHARSTTSPRPPSTASRSPSASATTRPTSTAPRRLRLLHFDGELWLDVTTLHNPFVTPARICSNIAEDFGLFAIARASSGMAPETSILSGPDGPLGPEGLPTSTSGSATFEFWTDQPNAITQCSIDGDPFVLLRVAAHRRPARGGRPRVPRPGRSTSSAGST